VNLLNAHVC
jgi:hypothetical protein